MATYFGYPGSEPSFIEGVRKALMDERKAYEFYGELWRYAPNRAIADRIRDIRMDEHHHYALFSQMLKRQIDPGEEVLEGQPAATSIPQFFKGVRRAYRDEVEAIMTYANLSLLAPDYAVAARVRDIMRDEVIHAEFFAELLAVADMIDMEA